MNLCYNNVFTLYQYCRESDVSVLNQNRVLLYLCMFCGYNVSMITTGAISISKMMMGNPSLQELNIVRNDIGDDGISAIAGALGNCKISNLDVTNCNITLTGAKLLATALYSSNTIRKIELWGNRLTVEGDLLIVKSAVHSTVCCCVKIDIKYVNDEIQKMINILNSRFGQFYCHSNSFYGNRSEKVAGDGVTVNLEMSLMNLSEDNDHFGGQEETRGSRLCCVM